jgi:hypothetical protein
MDYSAPITQSLTVWAGTITSVSGLIVIIAKLFGIELLQGDIEQLIGALIVVITGATAIYGRIRAKARLKGFDTPDITRIMKA